LKVAVTEMEGPPSLGIVKLHDPVPEQSPPQPTNVPPEFGVALNETLVPCLNCDEHVLPQLIPPFVQMTGLPAQPLPLGELVTVPPPELETVTSVCMVRAEADTVKQTATPRTSRKAKKGLMKTPSEV
jgi:hypothetical protein